MTTITELVSLLSSPRLRVRTGIWLYPMEMLGQEENEAVRLGVIAKDARVPLLASLPEGSRFLGLNARRVQELLDQIVDDEKNGSVLLVYNIDLLLSRLPLSERERVWQDVFNSLPHRSKGIILPIPERANHLLPQETVLDKWQKDGRLAESI